MIRRRSGDEFWLITQRDHARLSAQLAQHIGNRGFSRPCKGEKTIAAVAAHDDGWPDHDDQPTLNDAAQPLDVFESPRAITNQVWLESSTRAMAIDPYVGLLVTLHQFHLSAMTVAQHPPGEFGPEQLRRQFETNKFQHAMIERIEVLRGLLGLATDRPQRLGLADGWTSPEEDELRFDFRLLQALDGLSLSACCTRPPRPKIGPLHERPGKPEIHLAVERPETDRLTVSPWPFAAKKIVAQIPYRAVPARSFGSTGEFQSIYAAAEQKTFAFEFAPG